MIWIVSWLSSTRFCFSCSIIGVQMKKLAYEIGIYSIKEVVMLSFMLLDVTMGDRVVSFSPVKRALPFSPTHAVTEVGKSKKKRSVIMPDDVPNSAMSDPLMDVTSKKVHQHL